MQHYAIFLQAYNYDIVYRKSECNGNADCLSRLPIHTENVNIDVIDNFYVNTLEDLPVTEKEIKINIQYDKNLKMLKKNLEEGKEIKVKQTWNRDPKEFCLEQGVVMRGHRVVIPSTLKSKILKELHIGHFGVIKMKNWLLLVGWYKC